MTDEPRAAGAQDRRDEQARARAYREQLKQLHGADLGYEMAASVVSFGSQKLGLTQATAELRDLDDARLAIELLRALLSVLEDQGTPAPTAELRDTLAQLQLGYVHALQLQEAATAVDDAAAGEPEGVAKPSDAEPTDEPVAPEAPEAPDDGAEEPAPEAETAPEAPEPETPPEQTSDEPGAPIDPETGRP